MKPKNLKYVRRMTIRTGMKLIFSFILQDCFGLHYQLFFICFARSKLLSKLKTMSALKYICFWL